MRGRKSRGQGGPREINSRAPARIVTQVPRNAIRPYSFRRSWVQQLAYNPTLGWSNAGSNNIQISFALGTSQVYTGGASTWGPATPVVSEITSLFDQYKILRVTTRFDWSMNAYQPTADISYAAPLLYYAVDHDDLQDANVAALLQYPGVGTHSFLTNGYKPLIIEHTPRPLVDVASTGILTAYAPSEKNPYISTSYPDVPHYGLKLAALSMGGSANATIGYLEITTFIDFEVINPK